MEAFKSNLDSALNAIVFVVLVIASVVAIVGAIIAAASRLSTGWLFTAAIFSIFFFLIAYLQTEEKKVSVQENALHE